MNEDYNVKIDLSALGEVITQERHEALYRQMLASILADITETDPTLSADQIQNIALPIATGIRHTIYESATIALDTVKFIAKAHYKGGSGAPTGGTNT